MTSLTYLQAGFWENLSSESSNRDGFERFENMLNVSKALSNSVVITDVSESSIKELELDGEGLFLLDSESIDDTSITEEEKKI